MNSNVENQSNSKSLLTETLLLSALTLSGYLLIYCYEAAFSEVNAIPGSFIRLGFEDILRGVVFVIPVILLQLAINSAAFSSDTPNRPINIYGIMTALAILIAGLVWFTTWTWGFVFRSLLIWALPTLLLLSIPFTSWLFTERHKGMKLVSVIHTQELRLIGLDPVKTRYIYMAIIYFAFVMSVGLLAGLTSNKRAKSLNILDDKYFLLRRYGDTVILKKYDGSQ